MGWLILFASEDALLWRIPIVIHPETLRPETLPDGKNAVPPLTRTGMNPSQTDPDQEESGAGGECMEGARLGNVRWTICATSINYMDRQIIALLKPTLRHTIGLTEINYGYIVDAFQARLRHRPARRRPPPLPSTVLDLTDHLNGGPLRKTFRETNRGMEVPADGDVVGDA
jgi:hypothetical protein